MNPNAPPNLTHSRCLHTLPQVGVPPRSHLLDARDINLLHHAAESVAGLREYG